MKDSKKRLLGERIAQRRKALNISQAELAEIIGVTDNQISNIERGKSYPKLASFIMICEELDCNADYLLGGLLRNNYIDNIMDLTKLLSIEEQRTLCALLDKYIHRDDFDLH